MALHDELVDLRAEVGPQVFDDPVAFRAAFDDFIPEGSASTGEVSLLVGAIATGALQRLTEQLALGADPETSIAVQGDLLARDRGTTESSGARWALSVLAHALGAVPATAVPTRPTPGPETAATAGRPSGPPIPVDSADTGPTQPVSDATRVVSQEPPAAPSTPHATETEPERRSGRGTHPLLIGAVGVLTVVAVVALLLLFLRDGDDPDDAADDTSSGTTDSTSGNPDEEVVAQLELSEAGKTVRVQLVHEDTDAFLVLLAEQDGEYVEVDRIPTSCPYLDTSYDAGVEDEGNREIYWGWQERGNEGYGEYGQVQIDEDMLIPYGIGDQPCPSEN